MLSPLSFSSDRCLWEASTLPALNLWEMESCTIARGLVSSSWSRPPHLVLESRAEALATGKTKLPSGPSHHLEL